MPFGEDIFGDSLFGDAPVPVQGRGTVSMPPASEVSFVTEIPATAAPASVGSVSTTSITLDVEGVAVVAVVGRSVSGEIAPVVSTGRLSVGGICSPSITLDLQIAATPRIRATSPAHVTQLVTGLAVIQTPLSARASKRLVAGPLTRDIRIGRRRTVPVQY